MIKLLASHKFSSFLLFITAILTLSSLNFNSTARLLPLAIGILTCLMLLLYIIGGSQKLSWLSFVRSKGILDNVNSNMDDESKKNQSISSRDSETLDKNQAIKLTKVAVLLAIILVIMKFFGYLVAVPIFILIYLKFIEKKKWLQSIILTVGIELFMYLLFNLLLGIRF